MTMAYLDAALRYAAAGCAIFPLHTIVNGKCSCGDPECRNPGKHPRTLRGVSDATDSPEVIKTWWKRWPDANIGMKMGDKIAVDVDPRNGGDDTFDVLTAMHGPLPESWTQRSGGGGAHYVFKARPGAHYNGKLGPGLDLKHGNAYIVVEPSNHASGGRYNWLDETGPLDRSPLADAPEWLAAERHDDEQQDHRPVEVDDATWADLCDAVKAINADNRDTWVQIGMALHSTGHADAFAVWDQWSQKSEKYDAKDCRRIWASFRRDGTTYRTLFKLAYDAGWRRTVTQEVIDAARKRSREIGDGIDRSAPLAEIMDLPAMLDRLVFVADGSRVALRDRPHISLPLPEFKVQACASETRIGRKMMPTADLWVQDPARITTHTVTFRPGHPEFTTDPEGAPALNLWKPRPRPAATGDVSPFLDHVAYLVPDEMERARFLDWMAHIEQFPGVLPHTHYLMVTPQTGIGRNWLGGLLARVWTGAVRLGFDLVGAINSGFNGALSRRLLVIVDELKAADTGWGAANHAQQLKAMLTTEHRGINPKFGRQHIEFNCARWLMFSQHYDALPIEHADRRVIVITNPSERRSSDYYAKLYGLLDDPQFVAAVGYWLSQRPLAGFNPSTPAPLTESKQRAIDACIGDIERALIDLRNGTDLMVMRSSEIVEYLSDQGLRPPAGRAISAAYSAAGMVPCDRLVTLYGKKHRVVALRDGQRLKTAAPTELMHLLNLGP